MNLKIPFFLICTFLASTGTQAQNLDSLQHALGNAQRSTEKMALLKALADATFDTDKAQSEQYVDALQTEASRAGDATYLAVVSHRRGNLAYATGRPDSARVAYLAAYKGYLKVGDTSEALKVYCRAGIMHSLEGNYAAAEKIYRDAIRRAGSRKDVLAFASNQMGTLYHYQGIVDSARHYYAKSTALFTALRDTTGMLRPMYNHSVLLMDSGEFQESISLQLEIYAVQKQKNAIGDLLYTTQALANAYVVTYNNTKALEFAKASYRYARQLQDVPRTAIALMSLAKVNMANQDTALAIQYLNKARILADSAHLHDELQTILLSMSSVYRQQGRYEASITLLTQALAAADSTAESRIRPFMLNNLGRSYLALGNYKQAEIQLQESVRIAIQAGLDTPLRDAYAALAELYLAQQAPREAIRWGLKAVESRPIDDEYLKRAANNAATLYQAYKQLGQHKEALEYHEQYKTLSDSLNNTEQIRQITIQSKDFAFELEKQQLEINRQQSEILLQAKAQQSSIIAVSVSLLSLLGFGFLLHARQKNRTITEKNLQLEQLNTTKDHIFAIIGHDLRTPALAFRGITEKINYLLRKRDFDTLSALGSQVERDAQTLHQLTDNLLSWALAEKNMLTITPILLSLHTEAEAVLALFESVAAAKDIDLQNRIPEDQTVYADKNALHNILRNLIDNAVKFSHPGSTVSLSSALSGLTVVIHLSDTGTGMAAEKLHNIFQLQKGKSQPGTKGEKGTGLGLYLVSELVQLNHGEIAITSQPGQGTAIQLRLPAAQGAA